MVRRGGESSGSSRSRPLAGVLAIRRHTAMSHLAAKRFFITRVSSGLGRALAAAALADGQQVIGTVRTEEARAAFDRVSPGRSFGRVLDVTDTAAIEPLIAEIESEIGAIDVLVNNAGYGHEGTVEESTLDDLRRQL